MRAAGVIVEYNPLHNGHAYHLAQTVRAAGADAVVAVMSGNWLQRGEPALMNKWARAETALLAGADLVLELPAFWSAQPAEKFAFGAVSALAKTGIVESFCFGSESGDIDALHSLAKRLAAEPEPFSALLKERLGRGVPYPAAYADACAALTGEEEAALLLAKPNNSLGFHYLLALERLGSHMKPLTIRRIKADYNETGFRDAAVASATAIRARLLESEDDREKALASIAPYVPPQTLRVLAREWDAGRAPMHWERYRAPLFHRLATLPPDRVAAFREVTEGLEHRIKKALPALGAPLAVEALLARMKTKRYTRTKLQRMLTSVYLGWEKDRERHDEGGVPYLRVLGFTAAGRKLLARMKRTASVPIVLGADKTSHPLLALECAATAAYALGYAAPQAEDLYADYLRPPVQM